MGFLGAKVLLGGILLFGTCGVIWGLTPVAKVHQWMEEQRPAEEALLMDVTQTLGVVMLAMGFNKKVLNFHVVDWPHHTHH